MENASKALLIAGAVLIGIIVLGAFSFLFIRASNFASSYEKETDKQEVIKLNTQFEIYGGRTDITGHEVLSVINLANNYNNSVDLEAITVIINNKKYNNLELSTILNEDIPPRSQEEPGQKAIYSCINIQYNQDTKLVKSIEFTKKIVAWEY